MPVHERTPTRGVTTMRVRLFAPRSSPIKARAHAANTYGFPLRVNEKISTVVLSTRTSPTKRVLVPVISRICNRFLALECPFVALSLQMDAPTPPLHLEDAPAQAASNQLLIRQNLPTHRIRQADMRSLPPTPALLRISAPFRPFQPIERSLRLIATSLFSTLVPRTTSFMFLIWNLFSSKFKSLTLSPRPLRNTKELWPLRNITKPTETHLFILLPLQVTPKPYPRT